MELKSAIPTSDVTPYVVKSSIDATEEHICVIISSKKIQQQILNKPNRKMLMLDFTHDLSSDDLLVGIVGTPNANHEFSPICVALATSENSRSAAEMLQWTRDHSDGVIVAVLADGSRALSKAIKDVFDTDETERAMCYAHMLR